MTRRLMLTVDVEALRERASENHVDRLIWGRFPGHSPTGIGEMMTAAERHGGKMTMFLDYAEEDCYGTTLLDVGREIHRRGHDLELHIHAHMFNEEFWTSNNLRRVTDLNRTWPDAAERFAEFLCSAQQRAVGLPPVAFRGGGYRFNGHILRALARRGVLLDSSYNVTRASRSVDLAAMSQFRWDSGAFEIPISSVYNFAGEKQYADYNYNSRLLFRPTIQESIASHLSFLDAFYEDYGEDAIAVLVMHSWSLLDNSKEHFQPGRADAVEMMDAVFGALSKHVTFVTARDILKLSQSGAVKYGGPVSFEEYASSAPPAAKPPGIVQSSNSTVWFPTKLRLRSRSCAFCGEPRTESQPPGDCPACGAQTRAISLAPVLEETVKPTFDAKLAAAAPALVLEPNSAETKLLCSIFPAKHMATLYGHDSPELENGVDARDLSRFADDSFSAHFSVTVFEHFVEHRNALKEAYRVLRPGGVLLTHIARSQLVDGALPAQVVSLSSRSARFPRLPEGATVPNVKVGRETFLRDMRIAGFEATHVEVDDIGVREIKDWFLGRKPATPAPEFTIKAKEQTATQTSVAGESLAPSKPRLRLWYCEICGAPRRSLPPSGNCPVCEARARHLSLALLLEEVVRPDLDPALTAAPVLHFGPDSTERKLLRLVFPKEKLVSLYGNPHAELELGVDARDLSAYADNMFAAHCSLLVFDRFIEHGQALAEAYRVLRPGGFFLAYIFQSRLVDGELRAEVVGWNVRGAGWPFLPEGVKMPNIKVGRETFLKDMVAAGFKAQRVEIEDGDSGQIIDWFVGRKPLESQHSTLLSD